MSAFWATEAIIKAHREAKMSTWHDIPEYRKNEIEKQIRFVVAGNAERFAADAYRAGVLDGKAGELDRLILELRKKAETLPVPQGVVAALLEQICQAWYEESL